LLLLVLLMQRTLLCHGVLQGRRLRPTLRPQLLLLLGLLLGLLLLLLLGLLLGLLLLRVLRRHLLGEIAPGGLCCEGLRNGVTLLQLWVQLLLLLRLVHGRLQHCLISSIIKGRRVAYPRMLWLLCI
jgi:hypothetical protein